MILKQVIWKFQIYNILREIFRSFTKALRISQNTLLVLSLRNLNISRNKLYIWNIQITHFKMIHDMFVFYDFEIFSNFRNGLNSYYFAKIVQEIAKSKYFPYILNLIWSLLSILFSTLYNFLRELT